MYKNVFGKRRELTKKDKLFIIKRDKSQCTQCKIDLEFKIVKHRIVVRNGIFHHIIPQIYGGENNVNNACLLCVSCHNKIHSGDEDAEKYFKMYENFIKKEGLISEGING